MLSRLQEIASVFKNDKIDFLALTNAIADFENLALELSDIELDNEVNRNNIHFNNGKALGTTWAAYCIKDIIRTKTFIKGIFGAIEDVIKNKKGPVHILYAGTGPFATLVLPVMACYSSSQVQFTLLELNAVSFKNAKLVISQLGFDSFVTDWVNDDATKYVVKDATRFDIVISETMQAALAREQQVSIFMNLIPQLKDDIILIPQNITLELAMMNFGKFAERCDDADESSYIRLGKIFELNHRNIINYNQAEKNIGNVCFPLVSIIIPTNKMEEFYSMVILTEIQVYKNERIAINNSGLTIPIILENLFPVDKEISVHIGYKIDEVPGIDYKLNYQ